MLPMSGSENRITFHICCTRARSRDLALSFSTVRSDLGNGTCWLAAAAVSYTFRWGLVCCCRGWSRRYCCWMSGSCRSSLPTGIGKICCWTSSCTRRDLRFYGEISGVVSRLGCGANLTGLIKFRTMFLRETTLSSSQLGLGLPFRCRFLIRFNK